MNLSRGKLESVSSGSPIWLEGKIGALNDAFFSRFERVSRKYYLAFLLTVSICALAAFAGVQSNPHLFQIVFPQEGLPPFFRSYPQYILTFPMFLLVLGPIFQMLDKLDRALSTGIFALLSILFFHFQKTLPAFAPTLMAYVASVIVVFLTSRNTQPIRVIALLTITAICLFTTPIFFAAPVVVFYLRSLTFGIVEQTTTGTEFSFKNRLSIQYVLSPITFFFMMPLKVVEFEPVEFEQRRTNTLRGFVDIVIGIFAFVLCSHFFKVTNDFATKSPANIFGGIRMSLGYFACSWGFFRIACGSGRWMGMTLSDGSHFAILATSPMDSWKRWSTYLYDWMRATTFIPVFRRTKIPAVAFLASFLVLFLLHFADLFPNLVFQRGGADLLSLQQQWVLKNLVYFLSLGLLLYAASKFGKYWPSGKKTVGWLGVVVVQILLGVCHLVLL